MQVSPTKAAWLGLALCALAALLLGCRRGPAQAGAPICANDGVVSSRHDIGADGYEIAAEIVTNGCRECSQAARGGALPGSPCTAASVCAEFCCDCAVTSPDLRYRARLCRAGSCADRKTACALARAAIFPDICQAL
jgi:hypothetical protein